MVKKRGQFFLLAAVIISVVIISLNTVANHATVRDEPESFYDFSYEVQRESGAAMDYDIFTEVEGGELEDFANLIAKDARDKNPNSEFIFLYGNSDEGICIKNYGKECIYVDDGECIEGSGSSAISKICYGPGNSCKDKKDVLGDFVEGIGEACIVAEDLDGEITIEINGQKYPFTVSEYDQVIFIMQKDVKDENYVSVE